MNKAIQNKLLKTVEKNYKDIAPQYNETRKKHLEPLWSTLVCFVHKIPAGARILDIGCGNGRLLEAFDEKKIDYLGIDPNEQLVSYAKEQKPGFLFRKGNILELEKLKESEFDYIFSTAVIHHLPGKELRIKAFEQMRGKLKSNGRIILTAWNMWTQKKYRDLILKSNLKRLVGGDKLDFNDILFPWKNPQGQIVSERYYHAFTMGELRRVSKASGLKIEKLFKDRFNYYLVLRK